MNQTQLNRPDGAAAGAFECSLCRRIWTDPSSAERCCRCGICEQPLVGQEKNRFQHEACRARREAEELIKRIAEAKLVDTVECEYVYMAGYGYDDGFFTSMEEFVQQMIDQEGDDIPEFVFTCVQRPFRKADIDDVIERCTEESFEGAADQLDGVKELEVAIASFNEANKGMVSYEPDFTRKIRVPLEEIISERTRLNS